MKIDQNGDISSIYDKDAKHELLKAPIMLELRDNPSPSWPAWEVLYDVVQSPAREYVVEPDDQVIERGPARVALEITRKAAGSTFVQRVRLAEGADRVDVETIIDWRSPNSGAQSVFPVHARPTRKRSTTWASAPSSAATTNRTIRSAGAAVGRHRRRERNVRRRR